MVLRPFCVCSVRKNLFVQFIADVLVLETSLCQATTLQLASLTPDSMIHLCSHNEHLLAVLLLYGC